MSNNNIINVYNNMLNDAIESKDTTLQRIIVINISLSIRLYIL